MPIPDPSLSVTSGGIPATILEMQRHSESLFIALKTQQHLQTQRLHMLVRPARPGLAGRVLMRLLPSQAWRWQVRALRACGLFDAAWYRAQNPDVQAAGIDPALHYLRHGAAEGRDPGPRFSTTHYLALYPDVQAAGMNPLIHYLTAGWDERRLIYASQAAAPPSRVPQARM